MATNLAIDDSLLDHARSVGGYKTKRETVNEALREFIQRRERLGLLQLARRLEYDPKYDYKKERRARGGEVGMIGQQHGPRGLESRWRSSAL